MATLKAKIYPRKIPLPNPYELQLMLLKWVLKIGFTIIPNADFVIERFLPCRYVGNHEYVNQYAELLNIASINAIKNILR